MSTPRETRHCLNKMEGWFNRNRARFTIQRQKTAHELFLHAETALHADALGEALKVWLAKSEVLTSSNPQYPSWGRGGRPLSFQEPTR